MTPPKGHVDPDTEGLVFLPLGGAGEIGMNLNLYGFGKPGREKWIIVDMGVTFSDGWPPSVDLILPDPSFIEERRDDLLGIVLTHAHEDHLGAVQYLWEELECPVYATPFTRDIVYRKLTEPGLEDEVPLNEIPLNGSFELGPFNIELIALTHSIPEPNALVIRTPVGTVMHTGDWKFDPDPVVGQPTDEQALAALGEEGILAMVCDSTNVFSPGESGSEAELADNIRDLIGECKGRVAVACFASNVARLETITRAALANDRTVALAGRSLWRINQAARDNGYMTDLPAFASEDDVALIPDDKLCLICTGSQGEPRAALARIAQGDHPRIDMGAGDTVIFSSRMIPGNETSIARLQNNLVRRGIKIITPDDHFIHVSGHPNREELVRMYQHIRPKVAVPVHGELRHMKAHADLARECQVERPVVVENGHMVHLGPGEAGVVDHVPTGRLALIGQQIVPIDGELIKSRIRTVYNGAVVLTAVIDGGGQVASMEITAIGLLENPDDPVLDQARQAAIQAVARMRDHERNRDESIQEVIRLAVRHTLRAELDLKPVTTVHLVRIS